MVYLCYSVYYLTIHILNDSENIWRYRLLQFNFIKVILFKLLCVFEVSVLCH